MDVDPGAKNWSERASALDYEAPKSFTDGVDWVDGVLRRMFTEGWTDKSEVENHVSRRISPADAKFVRIVDRRYFGDLRHVVQRPRCRYPYRGDNERKVTRRENDMLELKTEFLFDARFNVDAIANCMSVGDGGWGQRVLAPVTGGTLEGPKIKGVAKNFGADWLLIRHDGVWAVDVRVALETDDGAYIHMAYPGVVDISKADADRFFSGEPPQDEVRVHTTPRFETGHENYLWLNGVMAAAIGILEMREGRPELNYSVYALR